MTLASFWQLARHWKQGDTANWSCIVNPEALTFSYQPSWVILTTPISLLIILNIF